MIFSQNPRSTVLYVPFVWIMWGSTGGASKVHTSHLEGIFTNETATAMMYAMGRKVMGHNTWFGKD